MYFSKNSRYVLQKAQILSPSLFKATEKNLSVKTPSDDPTKPPLRINIPKEASHEDGYQKRTQNVDGREGRSRSFTTGPRVSSITSTFEEGLLQKCESEMHFPNFVSDNILMNRDKASATPDLSYSMGSASKEDYNDGLRTPLQDETTANALAKNYADREIAKATEVEEAIPKSVYIIIDVPEGSDEKSGVHKETKNEDGRKQKVDRSRAFYKGSKSVPKIPIPGKEERTKRFEIDEIEDAATYVFHFKLNKTRKSSKLGCVPEKEVTVRNENLDADDVPVKIPNPTVRAIVNPRVKPSASIEEFPSFLKQQKNKPRKSEEVKTTPVTQQDFDEFEDVRTFQRPFRKPVQERKILPKFERDDFGTIRAAKTYPFRLPAKVTETKPEESQIEEFQVGAKAAEPQVETKPEEPQVEILPGGEQIAAEVEASLCAVANPKVKPVKAHIGGVHSDYLNIADVLSSQNDNVQEEADPEPEPEDNSSAYYSIHDLKKEKPADKSNTEDRTKPKKEFSQFSSDRSKAEANSLSFKTSSNCVNIESEKVSCRPTKFCAAFPPLLSEALKNRFKFSKPNYLDDKLGISLKGSKSVGDCCKSSKVAELFEDSILFPKKDSEKFDCESLLTTREEVIMNIIKNAEREKKSSAKPTKSASEGSTEKLYSDSLSVMKKVKEIVQFDLDNVVKIFNSGETKEVSSVVVSNGDGWKIDSEELTKQLHKSAVRLKNLQEKTTTPDGVSGDKIEEGSHIVKHLPTTRENATEMKLLGDEASVVTFDPVKNEFFIRKEALAEMIARKTNETIGEVTQTLDILAKVEAKGGDSILVFDDETQSWKVDFSILERREEQQKIEEELTKRSEMILETFEKLEKGQVSNVPLPETREKKTFDYKNEQWNVYNPDKKTKDRSKSPFKESDAEEIRKQNSDLFEDLFIANKKDGRKSEKTAPGLSSTKSPKKSKAWLLADSKEKSGSTSKEGPTPIGPEAPKPEPKPPAEDKQKPVKKDDNFWETFLNMNILPRDIKDIPKLPPVTTPPPSPPVLPPPNIDGGLTKTPEKKIEEPKFKIRIPFIKDKKIEKHEGPPVAKGDTKETDEAGKKGPATRGDKAGIKTPPSKSQRKEGPPAKKPPPTIGSSKEKPPEVKTPPSSPKGAIQDPKPTAGGKTDKSASATDHYVSDKIIEISRNKSTENQPKIKANKIETVKLNITSDTRLPSKVTEINLSKKAEEKTKETTVTSSVDAQTPSDGSVKKNDQPTAEKKTLQKTLEKYKTPYSEPDYEEKSLKIKSDIDSNPNLKKLDNWSKTLVLHDIMKPPENIESWLKDETDKMATLLLKVLQEAADGKPKKKQSLNKSKNDKQAGKANPYDNIRKKQETTPENFLFRVRTVNVSLENDKKKSGDNVKLTIKSEQLPVQSEKAGKQPKVVDPTKTWKETTERDAHMPITLEESKAAQTALETAVESSIMSKELSQPKLPLEITEEIPGPEILKKISNTWKMFPILGSQMTIFTLLRVFQLVNLGSSILGSSNPDKTRRHAFSKLFLKYGPIVNVQGPLSGNVILIHTPEHLTGVFEQDITTSIRSVFDSLEQSRREAEENGLSVGISTDWSKQEWNDLKRETVDPLLRGSSKYFGLSDAASESLVSTIRKNRNTQNFVSDDFMEDIRRWSLEGLCSVFFEKSFGLLEGRTNSATWILEPDKLYNAIAEATNCLSKCERGFQMWRIMSTPSAMGLSRAYHAISSILSKQLYQAEINLKNKSELVKSENSLPVKDLTFIESMLLNDGMTTDEITCNLVDMIVIGTNAMNSAMGFLLYNLAQNVKVQMKLLRELKEVLPNKDSQLSYNKVNSLKYLRACLKETLRLHFPVPVFYRLLQNDILLANYIVPKGTFVVMDYRVSSMKEQVFDDPDKFIPERWLLDELWLQNSHPFGAFPLCHGPRADLAKKVVELHLLTCAAKVIRNFQVDYQFGEIQGTDSIISLPDKPLKLNFIEREL